MIDKNINNNKNIKKINLSKFYLYYEINFFIEQNKELKKDILFDLLAKNYNLEKKYINRYIKISKRIKTYIDFIGKDNISKICITFTDISIMSNKKFKDIIENLEINNLEINQNYNFDTEFKF